MALNNDEMELLNIEKQYGKIKKISKIKWQNILKENGLALRFVPKSKRNYTLCKIAVLQNSNALQFAITQTPELCTLAVEKNNLSIRFVHNKPGLISLETYKNILQKDGLMLAFMKEAWGFPKDELYKIAIRQNRLTYCLIEKQDQTIEIQELTFVTLAEQSTTKNISPNVAVNVSHYNNNDDDMFFEESEDDMLPNNKISSLDDRSLMIFALREIGIEFNFFSLMFDQADRVYSINRVQLMESPINRRSLMTKHLRYLDQSESSEYYEL